MGKLWTCKDGTKIPVKDMTTLHLRNCINMMHRNGYISKKTLNSYLNCPPPNGDMAEYYFDQEFFSIINKTPNKWLDILEEELERRIQCPIVK